METPFQHSPSEYEQVRKQGQPPAHNPITLADGRSLHISQLFCGKTYAGLLAGEPNAERNKEQIKEILAQAKDKINPATEPALIPPVMTEPVITKRDREKYGILVQPQYLPGVTCIAQIESTAPAQTERKPPTSD